MRSFQWAPWGLILLVACGGGAAGDDEPTAPGTGPGSGLPIGGGGGGTDPEPPPPDATVRFDEAFLDLGRPGGFPSDLVRSPDGTLYTVDDARIPCRVLGYPADGSTTPTLDLRITANDLVDMDGTTPARAPSTFGTGLFGAFTGDLALAGPRWLFVTVGAGNSLSDDGANPARPLWLANLLLIDTVAGRVVQTVNLGWLLEHEGSFSSGGDYRLLPQSLPVQVVFVPANNGTPTGHVYVAMSNGAGTSAGLQTFYQGTIQVWNVDFTRTRPLSIETTGKAARDATRTFVSERYNPVAFTGVGADTGVTYLVLTNAGASRLDAAFVAHPTTNAWLEFLDLDTGRWQPDWEVDLGPVLPAVHPMVVARDGSGRRFGLFTSQTFAAVWAVDLDGLDSNPVDPSRLRRLRTIELAAGGAEAAGSGFQPAMALTSTGRTAVVSSFTTSSLTVLGLPDDIEFGPVAIDPAPFDDAGLVTSTGSGLGAVVFGAGDAADIYAVANGTFDASWLPDKPAHVATVTVDGTLP